MDNLQKVRQQINTTTLFALGAAVLNTYIQSKYMMLFWALWIALACLSRIADIAIAALLDFQQVMNKRK